MSRYITYAMDERYLKAYIEHKNNISAMLADVSEEKITALTQKIQAARADDRVLMTRDENGMGHINIVGPLEPKPDPCAIMFDIDMTTYSDIITGILQAEADPFVKEITFHFDTPGGNVVGLEKTANVIKDMTKPNVALIHGDCNSAGLWLASQCNTIEAEGETITTGSLGVMATMIDKSAQDRENGIIRHVIVSENAQNKALDPSSEADRLKLKAFLTKIESIFIGFVANGRKTTAEFVRENFGKGAVLIARDALKVGMIDKIQNELIETSTRNTTGSKTKTQGESDMGEITMTDEQLEKFGQDIATKTAAKVKTEISADMNARDEARDAETKRIAGFTTLKNRFPEMSAMIDAEMKKADAQADLDFGLEVADADKARLAAAATQKKSADDAADPAKPDPAAGADKDETGNILAAAMGLEVGGTK